MTTETLEVPSAVFSGLRDNLNGIRSVAGAIRAIIPPDMAARLDLLTEKSITALGAIEVVREPSDDERLATREGLCVECLQRPAEPRRMYCGPCIEGRET